MERTVAASITLLAVVVLATPAGAAGWGFAALGPQQITPDTVQLGVDVAQNGTASWTVTYRTRLSTDNETAAFADLRRSVRNNSSAYVAPFRERIRATVATAENATGRRMTATNFSVSTSVQSIGSDYGVVTYRFTWRHFAAVDGRTVDAGDAISGLYLDSNTTLVVTGPSGYAVSSVAPPPDASADRSVRWHGELAFTRDDPRVAFAPAAASGPSTPWPLVLGALALVVLGAAAAVWYRRRGGRDGGRSTGRPDDGAGADDAPRTATSPSGTAAESRQESGAGAPEGGNDAPSELLSNEERVTRFLTERGGRARQQELVSETGWTEAKTSQVVSGMRESGDLESFRIGRENVLKIPDDEGVGPSDGGDSNGSDDDRTEADDDAGGGRS